MLVSEEEYATFDNDVECHAGFLQTYEDIANDVLQEQLSNEPGPLLKQTHALKPSRMTMTKFSKLKRSPRFVIWMKSRLFSVSLKTTAIALTQLTFHFAIQC